jgi:hypothetical protein
MVFRFLGGKDLSQEDIAFFVAGDDTEAQHRGHKWSDGYTAAENTDIAFIPINGLSVLGTAFRNSRCRMRHQIHGGLAYAGKRLRNMNPKTGMGVK